MAPSFGRSLYGRTRRLLLRKKPSYQSGGENKNGHAVSLGRGGNSTYKPEWKGSIEGHAVGVIHRNLWRFAALLSFEDAYQEAYVKFLELCAEYEGTVDNPRWFMSLYKRAWANKVTDFANAANRHRRQVCFSELVSDDDMPSYEETLVSDPVCTFALEEMLSDAPEEIRQVLTLLSSNNSAMLGVVSQSWQRQGKRKEDGNEFLCRLLGYDYRQVDLVQATKIYIEGFYNEHDTSLQDDDN